MLSRIKKGFAVASAVTVVVGISACSAQTSASSNSAASSGKDLKVGWSTIYLSPSWMQETEKLMVTEANTLKKSGNVASFTTINANGDTSEQISQIRTMITQNYNVILVDAGSSTALNPVLAQAQAAGIKVVNFDSLVTAKSVVKVGTDQNAWGRMLAEWLVKKLNGQGNIIAFNGPAGVAVSDDRWQGAEAVFAANPGIKIVSTLNSEYNVAPAAQAFAAAYAANPNIDGVFAGGGTLSAGALQTVLKANGKLIPITGENYNGFLKLWSAHLGQGFSSEATAQPNYMGVIAMDAGVALAQGKKIATSIMIPLPVITDANLSQYVKTSEPDDYYPIGTITKSQINTILGIG
jgi:ribose transport system substrate-binding protein